MVQLDSEGRPVGVGDALLRTPGLEGNAEALGAGPRRAAPPDSPDAEAEFERAIERLGFESVETIVIGETREVSASDDQTRFTSAGEHAIELAVTAPLAGHRQVVLAVDEAGVATWHFDREPTKRPFADRNETTRTYLIRRAVPRDAQRGDRWLLGRLGAKVIRIFDLNVAGDIGELVASRWERDHRPYALRRFDPDNFMQRHGPPLISADWARLAGGRSLLFVHGTFSWAGGGFGAFDAPGFTDLYHAYGGRVFAFDHPTISDGPTTNAKWLLEHLPVAAGLDVDIVCHSRGGLVSRVLAESGNSHHTGGNGLRVHRLVLVAAPNQGTVLADLRHFNDLLDAYTTLWNLVPLPHPGQLLEGVLAVIRHLTLRVWSRLDGLNCMVPSSQFLRRLNASHAGASEHFAVSSDFEPPAGSGSWNQFKVVLDRLFRDKNDLLVGQRSAFGANGSPFFPIADRIVYGNGDHVDHGSYFNQKRTLDGLLRWLTPVP